MSGDNMLEAEMNTSDAPQDEAQPANTDRSDPVVEAIFAATSGGVAVSPDAIARQIADQRRRPSDRPDVWRKYLIAVRQHIVSLARRGELEILRKGKVVDPSEAKGLIKVRQKTD